MTADKTAIDKRLIALIKQYRSMTAYRGSKLLAMKYDTVKSHLDLMVKKGILYTRDVGKSTHYALSPNFEQEYKKEYQPDIKKSEQKTEGGGRVSVKIVRGALPTEVIKAKGFVCHANVKGSDVSHDFIRCHHNGEYQLRIIQKGKMIEGTHYIPIANTDQSIVVNWSFTDLSLNTACLCKIKIPSDSKKFSLRTVSTADGNINTMSIWVHPRYIYNVGVIESAHEEFIQQVRDLIPILESEGWVFANEITYKGDHHYAFNDDILGGLVQNYERTEDSPIVFDHSHGNNEMEVIGDNGELVETIANLPAIFKNLTATIMEMGKQIQILAQSQVDTVSAIYRERPYDHDGGNMYG